MSKNTVEQFKPKGPAATLELAVRRGCVTPVLEKLANTQTRLSNRGRLDKVRSIGSTEESPAYEYIERRATLLVSAIIRQLLESHPTKIAVGSDGKRFSAKSAEELSTLESVHEFHELVQSFTKKNRQDVTILANGLNVFITVILEGCEMVQSFDDENKHRYTNISQRMIALYDWLIFRSPLIVEVRNGHMEGEKDTSAIARFRANAVLGLLTIQDFMVIANTVSSSYSAQPVGGVGRKQLAGSAFDEKSVHLSQEMRNLLTFILRLHPLSSVTRKSKTPDQALVAMESGLAALLDTQEKFSGGLFTGTEITKTAAYSMFIQTIVGFLPFLDTNAVMRFGQLLVRNDGRFTKELYGKWTNLGPLLGSRDCMSPRLNFASLGGETGSEVPYRDEMTRQATSVLVDMTLFTLDRPTTVVDLMAYVQEYAVRSKISLLDMKRQHLAMYDEREPNESGRTENATLEDVYARLTIGLSNSFDRYFTAPVKPHHEQSAAFCYMELLFMAELLTPKTEYSAPTIRDGLSPDWPKQVARKRLLQLVVTVYQREKNPEARKYLVGSVLQHIFSFWPAEEIATLNALYVSHAFEDPERLLLRDGAVFDWFFRVSTDSKKYLTAKTERIDTAEVQRANIEMLLNLIDSLPMLLGTSKDHRISLLATLAVGTPWEQHFATQSDQAVSTQGGILEQAMAAFNQMEVLPIKANRENASAVKALLAQIFDIIIWLTGSNQEVQREVVAACAEKLKNLITTEVAEFVPGVVPIDWQQLVISERERTQSWLKDELDRASGLDALVKEQLPQAVIELQGEQSTFLLYVNQLSEVASRIQLPMNVVKEVTELRERTLQQTGTGVIPLANTTALQDTNPSSALVLQHTQLRESNGYIAEMIGRIKESLTHTSGVVDVGFAALIEQIIGFIKTTQASHTFKFSVEVTQFLATVERRNMLAENGESSVTQLMQLQLRFQREQEQTRVAVNLAATQLCRSFFPPQIFALMYQPEVTSTDIMRVASE